MKITERGWGGHFIRAQWCLFRRNTLIEHEGRFVVVSTVGNMISEVGETARKIRYDSYYETMVFESDVHDQLYHDADVSREIVDIDSPCSISECKHETDAQANLMHDAVVDELKEKILNGKLVEVFETVEGEIFDGDK